MLRRARSISPRPSAALAPAVPVPPPEAAAKRVVVALLALSRLPPRSLRLVPLVLPPGPRLVAVLQAALVEPASVGGPCSLAVRAVAVPWSGRKARGEASGEAGRRGGVERREEAQAGLVVGAVVLRRAYSRCSRVPRHAGRGASERGEGERGDRTLRGAGVSELADGRPERRRSSGLSSCRPALALSLSRAGSRRQRSRRARLETSKEGSERATSAFERGKRRVSQRLSTSTRRSSKEQNARVITVSMRRTSAPHL